MVRRGCFAKRSTGVNKRAGAALMWAEEEEKRMARGQRPGPVATPSSCISLASKICPLCVDASVCLFTFLPHHTATRALCPFNASTGSVALFAGCWRGVSCLTLLRGAAGGERRSCWARGPHAKIAAGQANNHGTIAIPTPIPLLYTSTQPSTTYSAGSRRTWGALRR
jgi:hypothetical protein